MGLLDARPLRLFPRFRLPIKLRGQSLYRHEIDSRPCLCETLHGHCWTVTCPCRRHEGEISR